MASPELYTFETEAAETTDAAVTPKTRSHGAQVARTDSAPLTTPKARVVGGQAARTDDGPLTTPKLRIFTLQIDRIDDPPARGIRSAQLEERIVLPRHIGPDTIAVRRSVHVRGLVGNATVITINGLTPTSGDAYVVADSGTLTAGSLSVSAGDLVEYSGSVWVLIQRNSEGYVPTGIRAIISSQTTPVSPYNNSDKGNIVEFPGGDSTANRTRMVMDGDVVVVRDTSSVYAGYGYSYKGTVPFGSWSTFLDPSEDPADHLRVDGTRAMTGALDMDSNPINNVTDPSNAQDAATKSYVDTEDATFLKLDGTRSMTGALDMDTQLINNVVDPVSAQDAATKSYVDTEDATFLKLSGTRSMTGALDMNTQLINNVVDPVSAQDAATKNYVDSTIGPGTGYVHASGNAGGWNFSGSLVRPTGGVVTIPTTGYWKVLFTAYYVTAGGGLISQYYLNIVGVGGFDFSQRWDTTGFAGNYDKMATHGLGYLTASSQIEILIGSSVGAGQLQQWCLTATRQ